MLVALLVLLAGGGRRRTAARRACSAARALARASPGRLACSRRPCVVAVAGAAAVAVLEGKPEGTSPARGADPERLRSIDTNRYRYWDVALEAWADQPLARHRLGRVPGPLAQASATASTPRAMRTRSTRDRRRAGPRGPRVPAAASSGVSAAGVVALYRLRPGRRGRVRRPAWRPGRCTPGSTGTGRCPRSRLLALLLAGAALAVGESLERRRPAERSAEAGGLAAICRNLVMRSTRSADRAHADPASLAPAPAWCPPPRWHRARATTSTSIRSRTPRRRRNGQGGGGGSGGGGGDDRRRRRRCGDTGSHRSAEDTRADDSAGSRPPRAQSTAPSDGATLPRTGCALDRPALAGSGAPGRRRLALRRRAHARLTSTDRGPATERRVERQRATRWRLRAAHADAQREAPVVIDARAAVAARDRRRRARDAGDGRPACRSCARPLRRRCALSRVLRPPRRPSLGAGRPAARRPPRAPALLPRQPRPRRVAAHGRGDPRPRRRFATRAGTRAPSPPTSATFCRCSPAEPGA